MDSGIWSPLDRVTRQIRLACLAPSANLEEQPTCSLYVVSLDDNPQYEALSYVWGDPNITTPIQLYTVPRRSILQVQEASASLPPTESQVCSTQWPVTTNLEAALRYLRHESTERVLWIDAICIDQSNIEERNHQVPLMKAIYSKATAVQVWLGSPTTGSHDAITILKQMGQGLPVPDIRLRGRLIADDDLRSVTELMVRPWWNRTWVQQELLLAKRAVAHCGLSSLEWCQMPANLQLALSGRSAEISLRFPKHVLDEFIECFSACTHIQHMGLTYGSGLEPRDGYEDPALILAFGRFCESADERDSVCGFLGLMKERIATKIHPDYSLPVASVFQDIAIQLITHSKSLLLLSLIQYTKSRVIPSWVPSWHFLSGLEAEEWLQTVIRLFRHNYFSTCAEHKMNIQIVTRNVLKLSGAKIDGVVRKSKDKWGYDATTHEVLEQRQWKLICGLGIEKQAQYISGGKTVMPFGEPW